MSNDRNSNAWKNIVTGIGVAAAGAALGYFLSEIFSEETPHRRCEQNERIHQFENFSSQELRGMIVDRLSSGTYECNICLENISRTEPVVSCKKCYILNHLNCIRRHCNYSQADGRIAECPSCRTPIAYRLEYHCFCGSVLNPRVREGVTPHCCLSMCSKENCILRCHPGPCSSY